MGSIYTCQPKLHRSHITAVDSSDPADNRPAVRCRGYGYCRLDISLEGADLQSLQVQLLFWNERLQQWFGGAAMDLEAAGRYALVAECSGADIFLKVTAFSGVSFDLSVDYLLS